MEDEKGLLMRDLEKATTKEEIEALAKDARELGHEDIVKLAEEKLSAISAKAESVGVTTEEKVRQVESLGGSRDEITSRTSEVDGEIEKLRAETKAQIEAIAEKQTVVEEIDKSKFETKEQIEAKLVEAKRFQKAKHAMSRWQDLYWAIKENREVPHAMHVEKWKGEDGPADDYSAEMERLENSEELAPWKENFKTPPSENGYWNNWANPMALDMEKSYVDFLKNAGLSEKYKVYNVMIPSELFDQIPKDLEEEIAKYSNIENLSLRELIDRYKNIEQKITMNTALYSREETKAQGFENHTKLKGEQEALKDFIVTKLKEVAANNPEARNLTLWDVAINNGLGSLPEEFKFIRVSERAINKSKNVNGPEELLPAVGQIGNFRTENGTVSGRVKSARVGGPYEIETNQGLLRVNKIYR